jgi:hypothetical protein
MGPLLSAPLSAPALQALSSRRPVRLEVDEHLDPRRVLRYLIPAGITWRLRGDGAEPTVTPPPAVALREAAEDRQVRGFIAWRAYSDALVACRAGLAEAARDRLGVLLDLLPLDQRARDLVDHCPALSRKPPLLRGGP